ncbi:MAG: alpha-hydroxy-acid oxidizing protein, partial [Novosphingobium sp.]|nr:alpha-hydroxy-acid oxidizing protein [Novosphingobium sp.]
AGGQAGVTTMLEILRKELDVTMALTGVKSIAEIGPDVLGD